MKRLFQAILVAVLLAALAGPSVVAARASGVVPKVVIVVGPSGVATDRYRAEARAAAALARRYTPDVTEIYSPDATWPAVRRALQGASLVLYMGHGNGWPSRYRDSLYPQSQDGFGLNPTPNGNDATHQYFGEARIASSVKLAPNAIVLLNHLCYASGNSEPGVPEGSLDQARQRVDNFAAGFIKAGAAAVVAEAYSSPDYLVQTVLTGKRSIQAAWRDAPSSNGHAFGFQSSRSAGYIAQMDPEGSGAGFSRSIVLRSGLASADILRGARGSASSSPIANLSSVPLIPSLVTTGMDLALPRFDGATAAGRSLKLRLPYTIPHRVNMPKGLEASVRWDPIDVAAPDPASEVGGAPSAPTAAPSAPAASPDAVAPALPTPSSPAEPPTAAPGTAPSLDLVTPERLGDVIAPVKVKVARNSMAFMLAAPSAAGRYRLTVTLHDADGVAYDAATQAMIPALIVRITGQMDASVIGPNRLDLAAGATTTLPLWVANLGVKAWGHPILRNVQDLKTQDPATAARVTGQWVSLSALDSPAQAGAAAAASVKSQALPAGLKPGVVTGVTLQLSAPTAPGEYLLMLDILTPEHGSLTASGIEPTIIRVRIAAPAPAAPAGAGTPAKAAPSPAAPAAPIDGAPAAPPHKPGGLSN